MDHDANCALEETYEWAREDGNEAIKTVISMLSPTAAAETSSFMVDTSLQLCPEAMRGHPSTPAATTLREYHFVILMTQIATAYADGRGQDFADSRSALDRLLQEEPEQQPLTARFRRIMGLWLQDAHNKRQQEDFERKQRRLRKEEEKEIQEALEMERAENDTANENTENGAIETIEIEDDERNEQSHAEQGNEASEYSPSSSATDQGDSEDGSEEEGSPSPPRAKNVFDLSGLIDTDEDSTSDDDDSSSDED